MKRLLTFLFVFMSAIVLASCVEDEDIHKKSEGVLTYEEYVNAPLDSEVVIETFIQAKQSWWEDKGTFYTMDKDGGYFLYNMACSKEDYNKLTVGTKIKVTGKKTAWAGEVEIIDATWEIEKGRYVADAIDLTDKLGSDLIAYQNRLATFKGLKVVAADEEGNAFMYNWNGTGKQGDDIYYKVSYNGNVYTFVVESYLCDKNTATYKAVEGLKVGDVIDVECFVYWYEGIQPHTVKVTVR